ncbi:MAG: hypothetical protein RIT28_321 [Pseudomonadota bacterium]|jgi:hypothetical protein
MSPLLFTLVSVALAEDPPLAEPAPAPAPPVAEPTPEPVPEPPPETTPQQAIEEAWASIGLEPPPLSAALELGRCIPCGGGYGGVGRWLVPHASFDLGLGVRPYSSQGGLFAWGLTTTGYWKKENTGLYLQAGVSTLAIVVEDVGQPTARAVARPAGVVSLGFRQALYEDDILRVLASAGVGAYRRGLLRDGADYDGFTFNLTVGAEFGVRQGGLGVSQLSLDSSNPPDSTLTTAASALTPP